MDRTYLNSRYSVSKLGGCMYYIFWRSFKDVTMLKQIILMQILAGIISSYVSCWHPLEAKEGHIYFFWRVRVLCVVMEIKRDSKWTEVWLLTTVTYKGVIMFSLTFSALLTRSQGIIIIYKSKTNWNKQHCHTCLSALHHLTDQYSNLLDNQSH